jgi:hypothetical protein
MERMPSPGRACTVRPDAEHNGGQRTARTAEYKKKRPRIFAGAHNLNFYLEFDLPSRFCRSSSGRFFVFDHGRSLRPR